MAKVPKKITLPPGSDLAVALRDAEREGAPVEFEVGDRILHFGPEVPATGERNIWEGYDPSKVLAAFRAARGAFRGLDRHELLADIHAQRAQDSRGRPA